LLETLANINPGNFLQVDIGFQPNILFSSICCCVDVPVVAVNVGGS